jgi:hypothetical protein
MRDKKIKAIIKSIFELLLQTLTLYIDANPMAVNKIVAIFLENYFFIRDILQINDRRN